jgi:hypothetical protein
MKILKKALMMCMSKHDQVLVLGSSSLGRVKVLLRVMIMH